MRNSLKLSPDSRRMKWRNTENIKTAKLLPPRRRRARTHRRIPRKLICINTEAYYVGKAYGIFRWNYNYANNKIREWLKKKKKRIFYLTSVQNEFNGYHEFDLLWWLKFVPKTRLKLQHVKNKRIFQF